MHELLSPAIFTVGGALISVGISWGILRHKTDQVKEETNMLREWVRAAEDKFVSHYHFNAVHGPVQDAIKEIQSDIKRILMIISRSEPS